MGDGIPVSFMVLKRHIEQIVSIGVNTAERCDLQQSFHPEGPSSPHYLPGQRIGVVKVRRVYLTRDVGVA
jgi:hypothetical protein